MPGHFWTMTIWCPQCYWLIFPCQFFLISPNAVLRNPGEIVDSTVKGSHEASSNWLRPSCSFWTWAFLPFHSPCRLSMCPVFYVAQWFFYRRKKQNVILQGTRFYSMTFTAGSSQPINTTSWDEQNRLFCHGLLVKPPWIIDPNWIPIQPHEILLKHN